jgi:hypothetical protein
MNEKRTKKEKYERWLNAVNYCHEKGWICECSGNYWIFVSPSGTRHDLSAADLTKLKMIEENGSFLVG